MTEITFPEPTLYTDTAALFTADTAYLLQEVWGATNILMLGASFMINYYQPHYYDDSYGSDVSPVS